MHALGETLFFAEAEGDLLSTPVPEELPDARTDLDTEGERDELPDPKVVELAAADLEEDAVTRKLADTGSVGESVWDRD